jgi:hypothetical protein
MKRFGPTQWLIVFALVLVVALTGLFAVRTVRRAVYWSFHRDETIRPWMSVPYVAHSYRVPPRVLYEALGIPHPPHDRRPIKELAHEQNRPAEELIAILEKAIAREREVHPNPSPVAPDARRSP